MPPSVALLNYTRSGTLSRIVSQTGIFRGDFSCYHQFRCKNQQSCRRGGGAQRPVLRVKKPKKTGVRTRQNPLVINVWGKQWHIVISNKLVRMVVRNSKVHVGFVRWRTLHRRILLLVFFSCFFLFKSSFLSGGSGERIGLSLFTFFHKLILYI